MGELTHAWSATGRLGHDGDAPTRYIPIRVGNISDKLTTVDFDSVHWSEAAHRFYVARRYAPILHRTEAGAHWIKLVSTRRCAKKPRSIRIGLNSHAATAVDRYLSWRDADIRTV